MGASMLRRSQTTSSHIRVISKNSSSASFSRFASCTTKAPRNAKKRAATRLRSAPTVGQSTQGTPYIRGAGGHEIFLRSPQMPTGATPQLCYISILRRFLARFQMVSMRQGALGDADASHWRDFRYPWPAAAAGGRGTCGCEPIIHAGDLGSPEVLARLGALAPLHAVRGNVDHGAGGVT